MSRIPSAIHDQYCNDATFKDALQKMMDAVDKQCGQGTSVKKGLLAKTGGAVNPAMPATMNSTNVEQAARTVSEPIFHDGEVFNWKESVEASSLGAIAVSEFDGNNTNLGLILAMLMLMLTQCQTMVIQSLCLPQGDRLLGLSLKCLLVSWLLLQNFLYGWSTPLRSL